MLGPKRGRLTAIIINICGTVLTIYLLMQFYSAFYALMIILFALSVSATQCRMRLKITKPVLFMNIGVVLVGIPGVLYLVYDAYASGNLVGDAWEKPITIGIFVVISLLNAIIIRNLHYSDYAPPPIPCEGEGENPDN